MRRSLALAVLGLAVAACTSSVDVPGGVDVDAGTDEDPLAIPDEAEPGSLDQLHADVIAPRCAGTPGLCHAGQFEPNLSTPALTYAYVVNRPSLEKPARLRVDPGNPSDSVLIDKLRNRDVSTQMPLGADPLAEGEIELIEDWIRDGALRAPGAEPAPALNNPPVMPEIAIFDDAGERRDLAGQVVLAVGQPFTIRHTVHDFETADAAIPFALVVMQTSDGLDVVVRPGEMNPHLGVTTYDPSGPMGSGDQLNYRFDFAFPDTLEVRDNATGTITTRPASGETLHVFAVYTDGFEPGESMAAVGLRFNLVRVQ